MRSFIKQIVNFFLKFVNLEISRKLSFKKISFDEIHLILNKKKKNNNIFDVGGSTGQSIDRFKHLFQTSEKFFANKRRFFYTQKIWQ